MQLVKSITPKIIKTLHCSPAVKQGLFLTILVLSISALEPVFSQDNSPYSRYGIGDIVPSSNMNTRAMGGITAGFSDFLSINANNPASFSSFQAAREQKSKKLLYGRALLDVGINIESRSLREGSSAKFVASNALFSYVQIGVPLKKNWGLSFGLRPVSRISYNIIRNERLKDPLTNLPIDSAQTNYTGSGGSYVASVGTGIALFTKYNAEGNEVRKLSVGVTSGYYFGQKDFSTRRSFLNDSVEYYQANFETKTSYGNLFFNAGAQYKTTLKKDVILTLGAYTNLGQHIDASQDLLRETFVYDDNSGNLRLDSVSDRKDVKGIIDIPASYTFGFVLQKYPVLNKSGGWLLGADFTQQNWSDYRFYGQKDSVQNNWSLRVGAQFIPVPKNNYFSQVYYRVGFFTGPDYIKVNGKIPQFGGSVGLGLPTRVNRQAPNQTTYFNLALEYGKRGNNQNLLRENLFRFSVGFSLSDYWFGKKKYD